jgi:NADPH:quinone reductase-like Zn-dependent oxidoreductase
VGADGLRKWHRSERAVQYGPGMRAILQSGYGSVDDLQPGEIARPEPADDEVLIKARAASVHPDVWHVVAGRPVVLRLMGSGIRRPHQRVPGTDAAGVVESVGRAVTRFKAGDEVFGETVRGVQWRNGGAFAEYVTAPEAGVTLKPPGVSFEEAAAVPTAGLIALNNLPQRRVPPGSRVLINGAAGGVGAIAVQLAKAYGAEVTGVDHGSKLAFVRSLGADRVIDYTSQDFTRGGEKWDLVFDVPGNHPFRAIRRALESTGSYILIGHDAFGAAGHHWLGSIPRLLGLVARSAVTPQLRGGSLASPDKRRLMEELAELLETGKLRIDVARTFDLDEASQAMRYLMSGQPMGRVVVRIEG